MVSEGNPHPQTPRLRTKPEQARAPHLAATGHVGEAAGAQPSRVCLLWEIRKGTDAPSRRDHGRSLMRL